MKRKYNYKNKIGNAPFSFPSNQEAEVKKKKLYIHFLICMINYTVPFISKLFWHLISLLLRYLKTENTPNSTQRNKRYYYG